MQKKADIAVITAMPSEAGAVKGRMEVESEWEQAGCQFTEGRMGTVPVVLCMGGVGKALAAMACTMTVLAYRPELVINLGVAGGLAADQHPLDLILAEEVIQADFDTSPLDGPEGLGKRFRLVSGDFPVKRGIIASQDLFLSRKEDVGRVRRLFPEATVAEMEAGAIAQVCASFGLPCMVVRSLSDIVDHEENPMDFLTFVHAAAQNSAAFLEEVVKDYENHR